MVQSKQKRLGFWLQENSLLFFCLHLRKSHNSTPRGDREWLSRHQLSTDFFRFVPTSVIRPAPFRQRHRLLSEFLWLLSNSITSTSDLSCLKDSPPLAKSLVSRLISMEFLHLMIVLVFQESTRIILQACLRQVHNQEILRWFQGSTRLAAANLVTFDSMESKSVNHPWTVGLRSVFKDREKYSIFSNSSDDLLQLFRLSNWIIFPEDKWSIWWFRMIEGHWYWSRCKVVGGSLY